MKYLHSLVTFCGIISCDSFITSHVLIPVARTSKSHVNSMSIDYEHVMDVVKSSSPLILTDGVTMLALTGVAKFVGDGTMNFNLGGTSPGKTIDDTDTVTLDDIAGIDYVKTEIEEIISFIQNKEKYTIAGAKVPRGVLLSSPPGNGKTLLARAIASSASCQMVSANGAEFVSIYVGNGPKRVRELFEKARKLTPCVVFIDEIDGVAGVRGASANGNDEREATLNQLLSELDGFNRNEGIVVIGATNRVDMLDPALTRSGRMDRKIYIGLPKGKERLQILKVHSKNKILSMDVDLESLSSQTVGMSGADLANLMNEAAILSVRNCNTCIEASDIHEAFDKMVIGIRLPDREVPDKIERQVCIHEAGHAIMSTLIPGHSRVSRISSIPSSSGVGGFTLFVPNEEEESLLSKERLISEILVLLGGRAAEEIAFGDSKVTTGASNDLERARNIASGIINDFSMGEVLVYTPEEAGGMEASLLNDCYASVLTTMKLYENRLYAVSDKLFEKREILEEEFYDIIYECIIEEEKEVEEKEVEEVE